MVPIPPAILAIGRNYADHAVEMGGSPPDRPIVFMKNPAAVIGNGEPIVIPPICTDPPQVDFEGELAFIIGAAARDVPADRALDHVRGYAIANDVSARWWQKHGSGGQFVRGKSFDTFCPLSDPVDTTAVPDPQTLTLTTRLNGEIVQEASTAQMLHPVATLIADLSRGLTLLPGTVVLTGTPSGVGAARTPPRFLVPGDDVEVEITGLGVLRNTVVAGA